jgi:hypothetical protein
VYLQIRPLIAGLPGIDRLPGLDFLPAQRDFPLTLQLLSEYVLDTSTGLVAQHRLLESRVNGQLTPADVVSRWIKRQRGDTQPEDRSWMKVLSDTLQWLDSM